LFGVETEYAFSALDPKGQPLSREEAVYWLMELARTKLLYLASGYDGRLFLQNGSCLYIDVGQHPEMCTPECSTPSDAVRYLLAGERVLADLAAELVTTQPSVSEAMFFKSNVDYTTGATWGCHESYLHTAPLTVLPAQIIPHLVSRVIYSGAGGFKPGSSGLKFTVSPRAWHLVNVTSRESTRSRGIFHTKDEPLSMKGYHRLHVLCGESLCSHLGNWLRFGATALVVALIEGGLRPGDEVRLRSPLEALYTFAGDPRCMADAQLANGSRASAIAIQRHYLRMAEDNAHRDFMPSWTERVCREWSAMLDRLEHAPESVATVLDWGMKLALYSERAQREGKGWSSRKNQYFEIDARFSQLGETGVFRALDAAGMLEHSLAGVDHVERAVCEPPAVGRARLRGQCVKQFAGGRNRYLCQWQNIIDTQEKRVLDLSDPFAEEQDWKGIAQGEEGPRDFYNYASMYRAERASRPEAARQRSQTRDIRIGMLIGLAVLSLWVIFWNTKPPGEDLDRTQEEVQAVEPLTVPPEPPKRSPTPRVDDRELDEQHPEVLVLVEPAPRKRRWPKSLNLDDPLPGTQSRGSKE